MSTKKKPADAAMKQKTLTSFFGKPSTTPVAASSSSKPPQNASSSSGASSSKTKPKPFVTPAKVERTAPPRERQSSGAPPTSSPVSSGRSVADTPPTSDVIDIDMDEEEPSVQASIRTVAHGKRKMIVDDSDSDAASYPPSSPTIAKGRSKKARMSLALSDDEDDEPAPASFGNRLSRFKKSPAKKARSAKSDDDDDFTAPSDSDIETKSVKSTSSRASSASSRRSAATDTEDADSDASEPVRKTKSKPKAKPSLAATQSRDSSSFLTAAEQRTQNKKDEKKAAEDPYDFLQPGIMKDKDGRKPGDPKYDPRTLHVPSAAWKTFTPFEKQFWEIKQNHYDTILFFQKGKFFELYEDDARIGHQEFDLKMTSRVKMSMVGVPEMSFDFWAAKFLGKGYKVGRVDQAETALGAEMRMATEKGKPKPKEVKEKEKIVRRELHKVYTNGTLVDPEMLTDENAGHCIAIREEVSDDDSKNVFGVCVLDCATSQFDLSVFEDDICRTKLETLMRQVRPKELLFTKGQLSVSTTRLLKAVLPGACLWTGLRDVEGFGYQETLKELTTIFPPTEDDAMSEEEVDQGLLPLSVPKAIRKMADSQCATEALGAMIWYLRQLNIDKDIVSMQNFNIYDPMKKGLGLLLDGQTLSHIEILLNNEGTEEGTLLKLLGRCITPSGKRLFRIWLCMPLREIADINARLDAVEDLMDHVTFEKDFSDIAKGLPDLERIVSRIHAKSCKEKDFLKVLGAFKKLSRGLNDLANTSEDFKSKSILGLLRTAPDLIPHIKNIESLFEKDGEAKDAAGGILPRPGKDKDYDGIMATISGLEEELDEHLETFEKKLKCKLSWWHSAIGNKEIYMVETAASHKNVPNDWTKNGGTKAKTRWLVGSLQSKIRTLKEARETRSGVIKAFRSRLFDEFDTDRAVWLRAIRVLAELDCLFSLSKSSSILGEPCCRPTFVESDTAFIDFKNLRHPTLSLTENVKEFIPNDVKLDSVVGRIALLTGPNMAGKSTVMRMTATGVIMAQLGMMVPADSATLSPVDAIITRMGAYDNMFSNSSTFKVELDECCKILRDATPKSLVILDELGRGTSTYDGMAIAGAVLHELATRTLSLSFFATHYSSLTDDFIRHPNIRTMHMSTMVDDTKRDIVFLYKLIEGVATSSFGTHVANLAGVPIEVVERADLISKQFAEQFKARMVAKQKTNASSKLPIAVQADFAYILKLAAGQEPLPKDAARRKAILPLLKQTIRRHFAPATSAAITA